MQEVFQSHPVLWSNFGVCVSEGVTAPQKSVRVQIFGTNIEILTESYATTEAT